MRFGNAQEWCLRFEGKNCVEKECNFGTKR